MKARVLRLSVGGLIVSLPDGQEGLVRERELTWDAEERQNWTQLYRPGDSVRVVTLGKGRGDRLELSIRLAQADSWINIKERYRSGSLVRGVVTGIMPYGVFVELEAGITGLLHVSRFLHWAKKPPGDLFWPGDLVQVVIDGVDAEKHRVSLSMINLLDYRWSDTEPSDRQYRFYSSEVQAVTTSSRPTLDMLLDRAPVSVLVVEDDINQQKSVAEWLRYTGQVAEVADSIEEAVQLITSVQPDIVLVDVGLPGTNGIEGVRYIKDEWPEVRCILMTDWSRAEQYAQELRHLRDLGISLLLKPLLPEDLLGALLEIPTNILTGPARISSTQSNLEQSRLRFERMEQSDLSKAVSDLVNAVRADKIVIFELDIDRRQLRVLEQKGAVNLRIESMPKLIHSPVRDVAEDGKIVIARNAREAASGRFLHLNPLLDFEACLGVPVPARLQNRYALFLFFAQPIGWLDVILTRAKDTAVAVGAWLERRQFVKQMADLQRIALLGQLGRALVHEISGRLTPINLALERLQASCDKVEECATTSASQVVEEARQARKELQSLAQQTTALARTTRSFSRMTRQGQEEIVLLEDIIDEAIDILSDAAATARVKIVSQPAPRLFFTRAHVTFLQQVMVNILQNAIQQIHLIRPQQGGRIEIRLNQSVNDDKQMLQMRIEDDGPGIHRRLWERIFEMDFTTRLDGSGLGLYISRSLIESQGGRISVASSHVLWGTTFLVELPFRT
jgi:signal transduction histidine kinase/predicted RNA-binding protein with RPS1 domain